MRKKNARAAFYPKYYNCLMKKVLLVTRVSGFIPQHEMKHVRILQDMGYEVHYASDFNNVCLLYTSDAADEL